MNSIDHSSDLYAGATFADMYAAALRRYPHRVALVSDDRRITYAELEGKIAQYARMMVANGLKRGDGFAILSTNQIEVLYANLAGQYLGLRYTPLHPLGSEEDHLYILDTAKISGLLVDDVNFHDRGLAIQTKGSLRALFTIGGSYGTPVSEAESFSDSRFAVQARPQDICLVTYTGGTTGLPKGVIHRHKSFVEAIVQALAHWDWPRDVRFLVATPLSHAAVSMLLPTLLKGGEFHVRSVFDPKDFCATIARERITTTFAVPSMIYDLLDKVEIETFDLSSLETVIYGAAPISPARLKEAIERIGPKFCQLYGQTEAPNTICYLSKSDHDLTRPELLESCGYPLVPNNVKLLRPDGTEAAPGEAGEICVRGSLVMEGYWDDPDGTAQAMQGQWLHTGDVAKQDDTGYLYIVDRVKDMVISGGFNIFTREVEDCLALHPAVARCAVIGIPHPRWGEAVAAFVVLRAEATVEAEELIALVREKKGSVQAPKVLEFLSELPLTAVGKVDKKKLRARHWEEHERSVA